MTAISDPPHAIARKTSTESVTSSTTNQEDDDLRLAIAPNEEVILRFVIFYQADTAADLKFTVTAPSGATVRYGHLGLATATTTDVGDLRAASGVGGSSSAVGGAGTSTPLCLVVEAYVLNGSTGGTAALSWSQVSSSATATSILAGSYMLAYWPS